MNQNERQDIIQSIIEEAEHYVDDFHQVPWVCRHANNDMLRGHDPAGEIDYTWFSVKRITKVYDDAKGVKCFSFITRSDLILEREVVDNTILNRLAQQMLEGMMLDLDPDDPLEAGFVPVSNYR